MRYVHLDPSKIRDISGDVLSPQGRLRIRAAEYWKSTTQEERAVFGTRHGIYSFPTVELLQYLYRFIGGRRAIEIGAGNGTLAANLGIPATDSRQQEEPKYRRVYKALGQAIVPYGPNIIKMDAHQAVRHYRPEVVIACWVTHKWDPARPEREGNEVGVDEVDVLNNCGTYVFIGNKHVHRDSALWELPHTIEYPPWLYSRKVNDSPDFIGIWEGRIAAGLAALESRDWTNAEVINNREGQPTQ